MPEDKDTRDEKANEEQDVKEQEKGAEEQEAKDEDKEKSEPEATEDKEPEKSDDKPDDPKIEEADVNARIDGLAQSMNSLIDLCTTILGAVQKNEPASEESHDPTDPDKKDDRLDDFASLLD